MSRKLGNLFFATIKKAARMQRQALKQAGASVVEKNRKRASKQAVQRVSKAAGAPRMGNGTWQSLSHDTAPTRTELLGRLAYSLYRPAGGPVAGLPLVIMLHGCRQTAVEMALGTRMNALADGKGFVVAYPQQASRVQQMRCWRWFQPDAAHGLAEADAIAGLARTLVRRHRLDGSRVYIAGLSAGAGMAALTVLRHPALFAAAALHSGAVVGAAHDAAGGLRAMRRGSLGNPEELVQPLVEQATFPGMPVMILHGARDRAVSVSNADQLARQFAYVNQLGESKETVLGKSTHREYLRRDYLRGGRPLLRLCVVKELGHAWSGGNGKYRYHSDKGPAASVLIWQFFSLHRRAY